VPNEDRAELVDTNSPEIHSADLKAKISVPNE